MPSPQLVGTPERATLDLNALQAQGVELVGRLAGIRDGKAHVLRLAAQRLRAGRPEDEPPARRDRRVGRSATRLAGEVGPAERYAPTDVGASPRLGLGIGERTFARWCGPPASARTIRGSTCRCSTARGRCKHDRGVVDAPGLYVLGLPFLRRRKSSFMHGAEDDVRELGAHLAAYLERTANPRAAGVAA